MVKMEAFAYTNAHFIGRLVILVPMHDLGHFPTSLTKGLNPWGARAKYPVDGGCENWRRTDCSCSDSRTVGKLVAGANAEDSLQSLSLGALGN